MSIIATVVLSVFVIWLSYRVFARAARNPDAWGRVGGSLVALGGIMTSIGFLVTSHAMPREGMFAVSVLPGVVLLAVGALCDVGGLLRQAMLRRRASR